MTAILYALAALGAYSIIAPEARWQWRNRKSKGYAWLGGPR